MDKGFKSGKIPDDFCDYISPIAVEIARKQEEDLEKAIYTVLETNDITVDKDELLKALSYDRGQYEAGYKAGYEAAMNEAIDYRTLFDWYISSVGDEAPVWTEQHIDELFRDYILIPKNANMSGKPIDGKELKKHIESTICYGCEIGHVVTPCGRCYVSDLLRYIDDMPEVDAQPVKHGRWSECWRDPARSVMSVICSACEDASLAYLPKKDLAVEDVPEKIRIQMPYCPKCGAQMEVDEDEQAQ